MEDSRIQEIVKMVLIELTRSSMKAIRIYFDALERAFGRTRTTRAIDKIIRVFEGPVASVDERISKIDSARANLLEGLQAIDGLKLEAEANKRELEIALLKLEQIQSQRAAAEKELDTINEIALADTSALRKAIGIPGQAQVWADRFFGFISGIFASLLASIIWWLLTR
jgi:hypothetical protein